jgi:serine phosphatase RsbU (regulator of sigma subunit)
MARMATVALALGAATTVDDLIRIVIEHGVGVLEADGGAVSVRDDDAGIVHLAVSDMLQRSAPPTQGRLPLDSRLPLAHVARTGEAVLLPTRASGLAWSPQLEAVYEQSGRSAWATLPLRAGDRLLGALSVAWTQERDFSASEVQLLEVFAAQCAQTLDRIRATEAQRRAAVDAQRLSEELQRSLLTQPAQPEHLRVAVRYRPAVETAQVGGDWHDCFRTSGGDTVVVIGDVNGHDRTAAAAMGQVRNLVRGLTYDSDDSPARLLTRLDEALRGLQLDTLATVLLGRVGAGTGVGDDRRVRLTWSSAGHLPAVLRHADGTVEVLSAAPDLMLGVWPETARHDHRCDLSAGATLLLYTDGLVERRGTSIDDGIAWLAGTLADAGDVHPEALCDLLVERTAGFAQDDDIALLALRT